MSKEPLNDFLARCVMGWRKYEEIPEVFRWKGSDGLYATDLSKFGFSADSYWDPFNNPKHDKLLRERITNLTQK